MLKINRRLTALLAALVMLVTLFSGCSSQGRTPPGAESAPQPVEPPVSSSSEPEELPDPEPEPEPEPEEEISQPEEPHALAMSAEFAEFAALDSTRKDWGPGGPVDDKNRSQGSLAYNKLYGKYNATFLEEDSEKIYLTFDQGYENGYTASILDTLKEKNVQAAFFITMPYLKEHTDLVRRMVEEGHIVGNHTVNHPSMPSVTDDGKLQAELTGLSKAFKEKFGADMQYVRPPKGEYNERTLRITRDMGYKNVFWSFAYQDWDQNTSHGKEYAYNKVMAGLHGGAVILLHAVSRDNAEALGDIIDGARAKGYVFRSLDEYVKNEA